MAYSSNDKQNLVKTFKMSEFTELRISTVSDDTGLKALDIRNWYCTRSDSEMKPTQKGVRIKQEDLADVIDTLIKNAGTDTKEDLRGMGYEF